MRAFLTGATGFIGDHLLEKLLEENWDVVCLARPTSDIPERYKNSVDWYIGDLTDKETLKELEGEFDIVFHLAGKIKAQNFDEYKRINVEGTRKLLSAMMEGDIEIGKFIFISSMSASGPSLDTIPKIEDEPNNPVSMYGKSKLMAEKLVSDSDFETAIIRPAAVYGPGDKETFRFFKYAKYHINPSLGLKQRYLSLIHVEDLVDLIFKAAISNSSKGIYHASDDSSGYSWTEIVDMASRAISSWNIRIVIPEFILKFLAYIFTLFSKVVGSASMLNIDKYNEMKQQYWLISNEKATSELQFSPKYDLEEGIKETAEWYLDHNWL